METITHYEEITTSDFSKFGFREIEMASELLGEYVKTPYVLEGKVQVMLNNHSGNVFLTDESFNVAMMNGNHLEKFYNCNSCGFEGFAQEFDKTEEENKMHCPNCEGEDGEVWK